MNGDFMDLHLHSCYSDDGEYSPAELVEKCAECGIKIMAIADHNCVKAHEEGERAAAQAGIQYVPAVEIDCTFGGVNLHVLGYGIDWRSEDFKAIEKNVEEQSREASHRMLLLTQELGFEITEEDMERAAENSYWKDCWTGEMFGEVLLHHPDYERHPLLLPYRENGVRGDNPYVNFYWDFYSQGRPCYVEIRYPRLESAVDIIHRNGGFAVLAHPGVNLKGREELLEQILKPGIDGLEAFSSYHGKDEAAYYFSEAKSRGLFVSCGSDYHGKTKPAIRVGGHGCLASDDEIRELYHRYSACTPI